MTTIPNVLAAFRRGCDGAVILQRTESPDGWPRADLRRWRLECGTWRPTPNGANLRADEIGELVHALQSARDEMEAAEDRRARAECDGGAADARGGVGGSSLGGEDPPDAVEGAYAHSRDSRPIARRGAVV